MTNIVKSAVFRAVCLLILGIVLVVFSNRIAGAIVQAIGALLILPGLFSIGSLLRKDKTQHEVLLYPILGVATILFGTVLIIWPAQFVAALMYTLAGFLILAGIAQLSSRWQMQKQGIKVSGLTFIIPVLTLLAGIFVIAFPMQTASLPFCIIGAALVIYAILELRSAWQIHLSNKKNGENLSLPQ